MKRHGKADLMQHMKSYNPLGFCANQGFLSNFRLYDTIRNNRQICGG